MTRTHRIVARQEAAPVLKPDAKSAAKRNEGPQRESKAKTAKGAKSAKGSNAAGSKADAKRQAGDKAGPHAKSKRKKKSEDNFDDDPILMHRAKGAAGHRGAAGRKGTTERRGATKLMAKIVQPQAWSRQATAVRVVEPRGVAKASMVSPVVVAKKTASVADFVKAAGKSESAGDVSEGALPAGSEIFARGESHPDEDERLPVHAVIAAQKPVVRAEVSSDDMPLPSGRIMPQRIDGFGGEGAMLGQDARGKAPGKTMRRADTIPATDNPLLAALARPSREELAEAASLPQVTMKYARNGKLIVPAPLKGSHEVLVHQNLMADDAGLSRIQDDDELSDLRAKHLLVSFPETAGLRVNPELPENRRTARPWTVRFATDLSRAYYAKFHQQLTLSSAVRTVAYQLRLQRVNGNAAAVDGEGASPHLTGQAVDFGKHGMSIAEIAWMRAYLLPLMEAGKVDVEEEFQQACFHISVYRSYVQSRRMPKMEVAQLKEPKVAKSATEDK